MLSFFKRYEKKNTPKWGRAVCLRESINILGIALPNEKKQKKTYQSNRKIIYLHDPKGSYPGLEDETTYQRVEMFSLGKWKEINRYLVIG